MLISLIAGVPAQRIEKPEEEQRPCNRTDNDTGDRATRQALLLGDRRIRLSHLEVGDGDILLVVSFPNGET